MTTNREQQDNWHGRTRRLTRRTAMQGAGIGLAASVLPGVRNGANAQEATPVTDEASNSVAIDRAAIDAALPKLRELAQAAVDDGSVPGLSLAVVFEDEVVLAEGFGVRSTETREPVGPDTVFQLASLSKPLSSTVVSAIVGAGAATWNDPIIQHRPNFLLADPWATREETITDMFAHRSGLGGNAGNDLEVIGYNRDEIFERLRFLELASSPRSTYAYSNAGLTVGGVAAAAAMDMSWEDASDLLLYAPLGMDATSSRFEDFDAEENRASLHVKIDGAWVPRFTRTADPQAPAGGASSSANDMAQWIRLLLGAGTIDGVELIPEDALLAGRVPLMQRGRNAINGRPSFYGRGWAVEYGDGGEELLGHAGAFSKGARTYVAVHPAQQLGIIVLVNAFPTGVPDGLAESFFDLVKHGELTRDWIADWNAAYDQILGAMGASGGPYAEAPESATSALSAAAYTGIYANDYVGPVEISGDDDALELRMGPGPMAFGLTHFDRDTFTLVIDLEPPAALSGATFMIGPDGLAHTLMLDYFADNGQQTLLRVVED